MAEQVVSDAALHPHDEGLPNITDGSETWNSAGLQMLLGQAVQSGSYVRSDSELTFTGHDGTNDQVDVTAGVAYIALSGETVDVQSGLGGSSPPAYDTTITANLMPAICVVVPTTQTNLDVQAGTLSQVWLAYDTDGTGPGGSAGDVYLRSDDTGSVTAPSHPHVELGSANPDNAGADTLSNRYGSPTFGSFELDNQWDFGVNGDGNPVLTDPQNGDAEVLEYDRSAGQWVLSSLSTDRANIGSPSGGVSSVSGFGIDGEVYTSDTITLADDATETIVAPSNTGAGLILVSNVSDNNAAVFAAGRNTISILVNGQIAWDDADTDTKSCVFDNGNWVLKNRTGASKDYTVTMLSNAI